MHKSKMEPEDKGYRRGFDQALAFVLYDNGVSNHQVQKLAYKRRVAAWRNGRIKGEGPNGLWPPRMTIQEAQEWRIVLLNGYFEDLDKTVI